MKKTLCFVLFFILIFSSVYRVFAQGVDTASEPSVSDLEDEIQSLKEDMNQMEIQSEMAAGKANRIQTSTFGLAGGSFEQDFESNNATWSMLQGQTLNLKFFANPTANLKANLDLEFWGYVANDLTQFSSLYSLANQNIFFTIKELDVNFDTGDFAFQAFKGKGYGGYYFSHDDFYSIFPDTFDVDKPFRYTGNAVPFGMSMKGEKDFDGLEVWAGPQLQWGAVPEVYLMYQHKVGSTTLGIINRFEFTNLNQAAYGAALPVTTVSGDIGAPGVPVSVLQYGTGTQPVTNALTTELTWKIPIGDSITWDNVGLYDPSQINYPYTYVENTASGAGTLGTNYNIINATTTQSDALGYQTKLTFNLNSVVDTVMLNGEYSGILAGDRERVWAEITKNAFTYGLFTFDAIAQQPLIGPNPEIVDPFNTVLITPRGPSDPFQVTSNPISGFNNREMTQFKFSFLFNPGGGWFFRFNPNDFGAYNVNTDLDTPFSFGIMAMLTNYLGGTDLTSYVQSNGVLTWDYGGDGQAATNGYQPYITSWTMWRAGNVHWVLDVEGGYSQSALSYNYAAYPYTNSFLCNLTTRINNTSLTLGYGSNNYGPEDWNKQFGDVIGQQYLVQLSQKFGDSSVSLKYVQWDADNNASPVTGLPDAVTSILYGFTLPLQELYATYTFNF